MHRARQIEHRLDINLWASPWRLARFLAAQKHDSEAPQSTSTDPASRGLFHIDRKAINVEFLEQTTVLSNANFAGNGD
jgi:hypothetical protein